MSKLIFCDGCFVKKIGVLLQTIIYTESAHGLASKTYRFCPDCVADATELAGREEAAFSIMPSQLPH